MHFLLINNNPAVSRLITLSVEKLGFTIDEVKSFEEISSNNYDIVFIDNEQYIEDKVNEAIANEVSKHFVYLAPRGENKPENMNSILEKPFLPTDFMDLVARIDSEKDDEFPEVQEEDMPNKEENLEEKEETQNKKMNQTLMWTQLAIVKMILNYLMI